MVAIDAAHTSDRRRQDNEEGEAEPAEPEEKEWGQRDPRHGVEQCQIGFGSAMKARQHHKEQSKGYGRCAAGDERDNNAQQGIAELQPELAARNEASPKVGDNSRWSPEKVGSRSPQLDDNWQTPRKAAMKTMWAS